MRDRDDRVGLNVWSPTVNLLRHPCGAVTRRATRRTRGSVNGPCPTPETSGWGWTQTQHHTQ
jgi:hypothetical protein